MTADTIRQGALWFQHRLGRRGAEDMLGPAYEDSIARVAERVIRRGDVVVDGGCNRGLHTMRFAHLAGPSGLVLAVDPVEEVLAANRRWFENTGGRGGVRWVAAGLSHSDGAARFHVARDDAARSSLHYRHEGLDYEDRTVPLATLDTLLPTERIAFLKLDTEGAEFDALRGGQAVLARSRCPLVFENGRAWAAHVFGYDREAFFGFFAGLGHVLHDGFGHPFCPEDWQDEDAGWYFWSWPEDWPRQDETLALLRGFWEDVRRRVPAEPPQPR